MNSIKLQFFCGLLPLFPILLLGTQLVYGQKIIVKGKITDANTGEPVTYATIGIKGTSIGTSTNFDGLFKLEFQKKSDSIVVSCLGYLQKTVPISNVAEQVIDIQLKPSFKSLNEVRITPKGYINPAWAILREVVNHKPVNDPRGLKSYQLESYSRIELDASNLSSNLLKKRFIQDAVSMADSMKITGIDHMPILPLFLSETVSDFFYQSNPDAKREDVKKTKTNGIGFEDGTLLAQLTGSTFQQYNFYKNFVSAAGKEFVSPITDGWKNWYDYELENRDAIVDGKICYQISFKPKHPQDLAFTGIIWIAKENYALYQIKATIEPGANLNFIHQISVQQQMDGKATDRPWLPVKTRILVDVSQLSSNTSGLLAKFYTSNKIITFDNVYPSDFFKDNITVAANAQQADNSFWEMNRPDSLTMAEKSVYRLIDTVKTLPTVRNYLTAADLLINGYYRAGNISLGPILNTYSYNNVEGNRIRLGFKTNSGFDRKWIFGGYVAYGSKDRDAKYGASVDYILSRKQWTEAGISFTHDLNQVALLSDSYLYQRNNLFSAFTRFGHIDRRKVFDQDLLNIYIRRDLFKGFTEKISFSRWSLDPQFLFNFNDPNGGLSNQLLVSEFQFETKWAPGSQPLVSETINRPVSVKTDISKPVFTFRYTLGLKNVLGSDLTYHKFSFNITQSLKMGSLGRGKYSFTAGYIPSSVPFPLLENHLGNSTFLYNPNAFNLMRFFEFASDKYASLNYTQHFEGLLLNSIPVIKNFKWRLVGTANILYGGISQTNQNNILDRNSIDLQRLGSTPYLEAGYGVENIFRFLRVDFIHRLTYTDNHNTLNGGAKNFGIKISAQIRL
ncbi:MAG: hypothetical protein JWP44_1654 [Mucilaginibacter sp.]|nr:hypothetical protein [Mucilaginibacter sp.]